MGGRGGGLVPGGGSRGASFGGLGMRAMFSLILVCMSLTQAPFVATGRGAGG
jgi:hypothetical protein